MRARIKRTQEKSQPIHPVKAAGSETIGGRSGPWLKQEFKDKIIILGIAFSGLQNIASSVNFPCTYNLESTYSPWILRQKLEYTNNYIQVYRDISDPSNLIPRIVEETLHNTIAFEPSVSGYCQIDFVYNGVQYSCRVEQQYLGENAESLQVARVYSYVEETANGDMQDSVCVIPEGQLLNRQAYAQEITSSEDASIGLRLTENRFLDAFFRECTINSVEVFNKRLFVE